MIDWDKLAADNVDLLGHLLRFDTTNPPGNETPCLTWISDYLRERGIDSTLLESAPGRGNLVARVRGSATGAKPLLLMGHVDVVPANPAEWSYPPFGGDVADGSVWGRGALDMKGTVATWITLVCLLRSLDRPLRRDVVLMLNADEEAGGALGAGWIAEHHWDLVGAEAALNEGGGEPMRLGDRTYYACQVESKRPSRFKLTARGTPGHASVPEPDNAVVHLARAVAALAELRLPPEITPVFAECVRIIAEHQPAAVSNELLRALDPDQVDDALDTSMPPSRFRERLRATARDTIVPTMLDAGSKINVISSEAEAWFDCRVVPGHGPETVGPQIEEVLRTHGLHDKIRVEFLPRPPADFSSAPFDHPLVDCIRRSLERHSPGAVLLPTMSAGATDSRYTQPHGVATFGFYPVMPHVDRSTVHGPNERIPVDQVGWATRVLGEVVLDYCGVDPETLKP